MTISLPLQLLTLADAHPMRLKRMVMLLAISATGLGSAPSHAMGLGAADVRSSLGQPLAVVIPLLLDGTDSDISADCFRLERGHDPDLPQLSGARLKLGRNGGATTLQVTTSRPVNDPALSFSIATQCNVSIRRDYTILLDTPTAVPVMQAAPAASAPQTRSEDTALLPQAPLAAKQSTPYQADAKRTQQRVRNAAALPPRQARAKPATQTHATLVIESPPSTKMANAAPGGMMLRISPSLAFLPGQHPLSPDVLASLKRQQAALQSHSADQLDDDITALKMQLAQTRQTLASLQATAPAKTPLTHPIATPTTPGMGLSTRYLLPLAGLVLLVALGLYWLRRNTMRRRVDGMMDFRDTTWSELPDAPAAAATPAPVAPALASESEIQAAPNQTQTTKDDADWTHPQPIKVSSLSRVTEEASVFCRLGYPQRAVELLQEHIASTPVSHPQAWYVLFDIYREHNMREAFDSSLVDFNRRFNLVTPSWQNAAEQNGADLQSFAHVIERITQLWPGAACKTYIKGLLYDDRGGERQGFSMNTYHDLLFLIELLDTQLAEDTPDAAHAGSHLRLV